MKKIYALALLALAGCNTTSLAQLTPAQEAALFCVISQDGVALATALSTSAKAQASAAKYQAAQVVLCSASTQVGQALGASVQIVAK